MIDIFAKKLRMHFKTTYKIAYETVDTADIVVLKLEDERGFYGLGSAAPDFEVTGESVDSVLKILQENITSDFFETSFDAWYWYHQEIEKACKGNPSAQSALEEAYLNLLCARMGITIKYLFGGYRKTCLIIMSIGLKNIDETVTEAKEKIEAGYRIIKLKCGHDVEEDIEKLTRVSSILPKGRVLSLDANQGYEFGDAEKIIKTAKNLGTVQFIEQPLSSDDWDAMKALRKWGLPIYADESVVSEDSLMSLLSGDYVDGVVLKLMKCGGPVNFVSMFHIAKAFHKGVMIGCMYESNISVTTGAYLALALPIDFVDLDTGHLDFLDDPALGGVEIIGGRINNFSPLALR
ncbi:MAG: dipeptide epimerase [Candidatus Magasanikbacteria bacterium]|nr:dipeptide epimerase [Candidatus Magasanikbacteria bacterium]